jgi:hypothetical protein
MLMAQATDAAQWLEKLRNLGERGDCAVRRQGM